MCDTWNEQLKSGCKIFSPVSSVLWNKILAYTISAISIHYLKQFFFATWLVSNWCTTTCRYKYVIAVRLLLKNAFLIFWHQYILSVIKLFYFHPPYNLPCLYWYQICMVLIINRNKFAFKLQNNYRLYLFLACIDCLIWKLFFLACNKKRYEQVHRAQDSLSVLGIGLRLEFLHKKHWFHAIVVLKDILSVVHKH